MYGYGAYHGASMNAMNFRLMLYATFKHPHLASPGYPVQKAQFPYHPDWFAKKNAHVTGQWDDP